MRAMPVVIVEEGREPCAAIRGMGIGVSVGPFAQGGLDEAFGFAVGPWRIGAGETLFETETSDFSGVGSAAVAGAVVGKETLDLDPELSEEGESGEEKGDGALRALVREELGEGDAGVIIDGDVKVLPTGAAGVIALAVAGDAMAEALDAGELLNIEVDEFARSGPLVAAQRWRRLQGAQALETVAAQQTRDGGLGELGLAGDLEAWQFATAQSQDAGDAEAVGGSGGTFGARTAVLESGEAPGAEASKPLVRAALGDAESGGDLGDGLLEFEDTFDPSRLDSTA